MPLVPFRSSLHRLGQTGFAGHIVDSSDLDRRYVVELLIDGVAVRTTTAQDYDPELDRAGVGDAFYGFSFQLAADMLADCKVVEARIANIGTIIGAPIRLDVGDDELSLPRMATVEWLGGLRFRGTIEAHENASAYINVSVDGETIVQAPVKTWRHAVAATGKAKAVPGFDVHLPARFADGTVKQAHFVDPSGEELAGSPVKFVAFEDGLRNVIASLGQIETERLRGELFDRLVPMSLPLGQYASWCERFPFERMSMMQENASIAVVLIGPGDMQLSLETLEQQGSINWVALALPYGEETNAFDAPSLKAFLETEACECDTVVFALAGTAFEPEAFERLRAAWKDFPQASLVYGDVSIAGENGQSWPIALSAFDYERMLEQGMGAMLFTAQRQRICAVLKDEPTNIYRLFNCLAGAPADETVVHLPRSLGVLPAFDLAPAAQELAQATHMHLAERGIETEIVIESGTIFPAVRVMRLTPRPSISIMIPVRNRADLLRRCLETIAPALEQLETELIIIDNDSSEPAMLRFLESIDGPLVKILKVAGPFNYAKLNNRAAAIATGDVLCLLNNDIEALDDFWLDEMLSRLVEPDVGAVGAQLIWPSGVIQHGGIVLGSSLSAAHAFTDRMADDPGYGDLMRVAHQCSAVTAACMLTPRADYLSVGGLDEIFFPVNYNDIDYCLKLRALGKRIVFTPHARLLHHESLSRGKDLRADRAGRFQRELRILRARWLESLVDDPFYNPALSLDPIPFSALAWPPRSVKPRLCTAPAAISIPGGL